MAHPYSTNIDLAKPVAEDLGLELVSGFHTNQRPPVLRVDIRNPSMTLVWMIVNG